MLVPVYFLIALWGHAGSDGKSRIYAATKFFIYTQVGGLLLLVGILALVLVNFQATGTLSFDYDALLGAHKYMRPELEMALMLCFFTALPLSYRLCRFIHGCLMLTRKHLPQVVWIWQVFC